MIFATPGNLSGKGCRDSQGLFVPVPQCRRRRRLTGGFGQLDPPLVEFYKPQEEEVERFTPIAPDPGSYQQVWDVLRQTCVSMAGEDACNRLLGHTPFVCPVEEPRKRSFLIPLLIGAAIGKMIL